MEADGEFIFTWSCCGFLHRYRKQQLPQHEEDVLDDDEEEVLNDDEVEVANQNQHGQHDHWDLNEDTLLIQGFEAFFGEAQPWARMRDAFLPLRTNRSIRAQMQILIRCAVLYQLPPNLVNQIIDRIQQVLGGQ
ncbi:pyrimidine monooxygenase RutA-like protein [Corchorus capsularis]|uniref:Pyrimidine monooxygenase RutA-like protein n=1 Tax=Corchorus capsularis TaxID=210143 RepID=A0A1R3FW55_COCAP|nr:pyrimidine monooxygenase RutA-like protein [Corchorus capsularis]